MYNRILHNRQLPYTLLTLMTLLLMPAIVQAQSIVITSAPETDAARQQQYQKSVAAIAAIQKHYQDTHKSVIVTVDYVDIPLTDLLEASQWIASGQQHDALLLAALIKAGAQDMKGTTVQAWDSETDGRGTRIPVIVAGTSQTQPQDIFSYTEATPHFNADGTIKVLIRLELGEAHAIPPASSEPGYQCVAATLQDGQTFEAENSIPRSSTGGSLAHLTFVTVTSATGDNVNNVNSEPVPQIPPASAGPAKRRSGDPGMILAPPNMGTLDQSMVLGRGTHPERMDSINLFPPSVSVSPMPQR